MDYDTGEIRRVARQIGRTVNEVNDIARSGMKPMISQIPANLKGSTADALEDVVTDLTSDISRIGAQLEAIRRYLIAFANALDEADRKAQQAIKSR